MFILFFFYKWYVFLFVFLLLHKFIRNIHQFIQNTKKKKNTFFFFFLFMFLKESQSGWNVFACVRDSLTGFHV